MLCPSCNSPAAESLPQATHPPLRASDKTTTFTLDTRPTEAQPVDHRHPRHGDPKSDRRRRSFMPLSGIPLPCKASHTTMLHLLQSPTPPHLMSRPPTGIYSGGLSLKTHSPANPLLRNKHFAPRPRADREEQTRAQRSCARHDRVAGATALWPRGIPLGHPQPPPLHTLRPRRRDWHCSCAPHEHSPS